MIVWQNIFRNYYRVFSNMQIYKFMCASCIELYFTQLMDKTSALMGGEGYQN